MHDYATLLAAFLRENLESVQIRSTGGEDEIILPSVAVTIEDSTAYDAVLGPCFFSSVAIALGVVSNANETDHRLLVGEITTLLQTSDIRAWLNANSATYETYDFRYSGMDHGAEGKAQVTTIRYSAVVRQEETVL